MRSHKFGISSEAITIDCMEFREIQPTLEELNQLSQGGIRVTALPDEIGGPISPEIHLAFKGDNGEFSLKIAENLNSEEMNKLYILFVEMAKLLSKK